MKGVREEAAGQRLARGAKLLVNAAAIVCGQETAGAIGALANALQCRQFRDRFEQVAVAAFHAVGFTEPCDRIAAPVEFDLFGGDDDIEPMTAAAA